MVEFADATNEASFIESIRDIFRAYVPESDAWAKPNFFDVNATVIGGLSWSAVNEARNGVDARLNPQTAVGDALDIIAATPPLSLTRLSETKATGFITVNFPAETQILAGTEFKTEAGITFIVDTTTILVGGESSLVPVTSENFGSDNNAVENQPLTSVNLVGVARSGGVYGASDVECDDQLRQRIYAAYGDFCFFGSAKSYQKAMLGFTGISRSWPVTDGCVVKILYLMEDTYPCGVPTQADTDALVAFFNDECRTNMFYCPNFEGAKSLKITPKITWAIAPNDFCEVETTMTDWLRANYDLGQGVMGSEIQCFVNDIYPELGGVVECCDSYPPVCDAVYNCVEIIQGC